MRAGYPDDRAPIPGNVPQETMSELASESMSQCLRPARERASGPSALRPAKATERSEGER